MRIEESIYEVMDEWRDVIKNKKRLIFSFEDRAEIRLNTIKEQMYSQRIPLRNWQYQEGYFRKIGQY